MTSTGGMRWKEIPVDQYCDSVRDGTHDSPTFLDAGFPLITSKSIKMGQIILDSANLISEHDFNEINRRSKVDQWDVLFSMIGTVGEVCLVHDEEPSFAIKNIGLFKNGDELKGKWLYYWLTNPITKAGIKQAHRGASQQYIPLGELRKLPIRVPIHQDVMHRVVAILSVYDNLIENNRRRMALLEESARLLYREWFVRLRFPGYEHTPIVDGVPQGWRSISLAEISTKIGSGFTPRGGEASYHSEGVTLIRSMNVYDDNFDDGGLAFLSEEQAATLAGVAIEAKDILINITGASVARCCMAPERYLPARVNQHVMIIRVDPGKADPFFVHKAINSDEQKRLLLSYAQKGSTREALTKEGMARFEITVPTASLMRQFGEIAASSFKQREILAQQNQKLRTARDLLLPRLMSGELAV